MRQMLEMIQRMQQTIHQMQRGISARSPRAVPAPPRLRSATPRCTATRIIIICLRHSQVCDPEVAPDLPQKVEQLRYCELAPQQAVLYNQVCKEMLHSVEEVGQNQFKRQARVLAAMQFSENGSPRR